MLYGSASVIVLCKKKMFEGLLLSLCFVWIFKNSFYGSSTFVKFLSQQRNRCNALSRSLTNEERNLIVFFPPSPSFSLFVFIGGDSVILLSYNFEWEIKLNKAHTTSSTYDNRVSVNSKMIKADIFCKHNYLFFINIWQVLEILINFVLKKRVRTTKKRTVTW